MNLKPLTIGDITIPNPIIQGGMGIGVSLSGLASAVTRCGGLGVISAANIGFKSTLFKTNPLEANLTALKKQILLTKELALNGPIGVNIMAATNKYEEYVKVAVDAGVDIIISGAGLPVKLPKLIKGSATKFAPIVSSLKATKVLFKMWDKKENMACDMVVVENHKAGGHLGFKPEKIEEYFENDNFDEEFISIVEYVKEFEKKYNKNIPVIYAGGVFDHEDIVHCINLGASGVQMSTRFVTTHECDAHDNFKQAYINAKEDEIALTKSPVGMPGRAIKNAFLKRSEKEKITHCYKCMANCDIEAIPYCITKVLMDSVEGDVDNGMIFCGTNAYKCDEIISVEELMEKLINPSVAG